MTAKIAALVAGAVFVTVAGGAEAAPIVYDGTLQPGVQVGGTNTQPPGDFDNPDGADYWLFVATAGSVIDLVGDRQAGHYDPAFWIFAGNFGDTSAFGAVFDGGDPGFIGFFDDQDPPNVPGFFGDPHATFVAPVSGLYTLVVTNNLSAAGAPNPYTLLAKGIVAIPEPTSIVLVGAVLAGLAAARRR